MKKVVLYNNNKLVKIFYKGKNLEKCYLHFNEQKRISSGVLIPRKYVNNGDILKSNYIVYIIDSTPGIEPRMIRDSLGRNILEEQFIEDWTIIDSFDYNLEESFWVFGHNPKSVRFTIKGVMKIMMSGSHDSKNYKQVIKVNNKLIFYNENQFDMVICKNVEDCNRLYKALYISSGNGKVKFLHFMGSVSKYKLSDYYDLIGEKTGWNRRKVNRKSTKP